MRKKFKILPLKNSDEKCIVDACDFERLNRLTWSLKIGRRGPRDKYVIKTGGGKMVFLHKYILGLDSGVDHKDRDTLNNRRQNLRPCTTAQNVRNRGKMAGKCHSKFKGLSLKKGLWQVEITKDYKKTRVGTYKNELQAAKAYDAAAIFLFGEFACLNFKSSTVGIDPATLHKSAVKSNRTKYRSDSDGVGYINKKCKNHWRAYISFVRDGRALQIHLGSFPSRKIARSVRLSAENVIIKNNVDETWSSNKIKSLFGKA